MYEMETKVLKQAVRRNLERFPEDFMFQLSEKEWNTLLRSQFASLKTGSGRQPKYLPFAFTEHGVSSKTIYNWLRTGVVDGNKNLVLELNRLRKENEQLYKLLGRATAELNRPKY